MINRSNYPYFDINLHIFSYFWTFAWIRQKNYFAKEIIEDWNLIIGCTRGAKERMKERMTESSTYSKKNSTEFFCKQINVQHWLSRTLCSAYIWRRQHGEWDDTKTTIGWKWFNCNVQKSNFWLKTQLMRSHSFSHFYLSAHLIRALFSYTWSASRTIALRAKEEEKNTNTDQSHVWRHKNHVKSQLFCFVFQRVMNSNSEILFYYSSRSVFF